MSVYMAIQQYPVKPVFVKFILMNEFLVSKFYTKQNVIISKTD
ncbi:hypothetical protein BH10BAC2_BH10BAC2_45530 [soil metagenome]